MTLARPLRSCPRRKTARPSSFAVPELPWFGWIAAHREPPPNAIPVVAICLSHSTSPFAWFPLPVAAPRTPSARPSRTPPGKVIMRSSISVSLASSSETEIRFDTGDLLGCVIAHELGHLLLGQRFSLRNRSDGSAVWQANEVRHGIARAFSFSRTISRSAFTRAASQRKQHLRRAASTSSIGSGR